MNSSPRFATAAEIGLSEIDQIKIALELILSQGGIAVMSQIYEAVEGRFPPEVYLSDQGKDSLRQTINRSAVKAGYIHRHDKQKPGWLITEKGVKFIRQELGHVAGEVRVTARAFVNFQLALKEIQTLLTLYDDLRQRLGERKSVEVMKRAGIILIVTAWETFIEDIIELYVNQQLDKASSPSEMEKVFNAIAQTWYQAIRDQQNKKPPKPTEFIKWTGDNWKKLIRDKLQEDLASLNTPKAQNVRDLSKKYLGEDISSSWTWGRMSADKARKKLDKLIDLRGELAHRTGNYFEIGSSVRRNDLVDYLDFIKKLVDCTETAVNKL